MQKCNVDSELNIPGGNEDLKPISIKLNRFDCYALESADVLSLTLVIIWLVLVVRRHTPN